MFVRRRHIGTLLLLFLVAAPHVHARPASFDEHVAAGQRLYAAHEYEAAIAELEAAYRMRPVSRLLFNLGIVHRKLGHTQTALSYFERYRDGRKTLDTHVPIDRYIDELRAQLATGRDGDADAAPPPAVDTAAAPVHAAPSAPTASTSAPSLAPTIAPARTSPLALELPPPPRSRARPLWSKWWLWAATATGAAAVAVAVGVGVTRGQSNEPSFVVQAR